MDITKKLQKICFTKTNINLSSYSNMRCGGEARYMCFPKSLFQAKRLLRFLTKNNIEYYVFGNGTNILFKDNSHDIVFINLKKLNQIKVFGKNLSVQSGTSLSKISNCLKTKNLSGFEWSYGIPGTAGGAVYMNAGAYGGEISNHILYAICYDKKTRKNVKLKQSQMQFAYRRSVFQYDRYIILKVKLFFEHGNRIDIEQKQKEYMQKRKSTQPLASFNLGSIFKKAKNKSAGQIIDELGLKGYKIGGAYISKIHANFIINDGTATAQDVIDVINYVKDIVFNKCNIKLEEEIKIV